MLKIRKRNSITHSIIYATIFVIVNVLGIGYGSWVNNTTIKTVISTGNIAPIFSIQPIVTEFDTPLKPTDSGAASVYLSDDQKTMYVSLSGAYPGYSVIINYTISNMGTIPIKCKISSTAPKPINADFSTIDEVLNPHGGSKNGTINISIPKNVKEGTNYGFEINLQFEQYNLEN